VCSLFDVLCVKRKKSGKVGKEKSLWSAFHLTCLEVSDPRERMVKGNGMETIRGANKVCFIFSL